MSESEVKEYRLRGNEAFKGARYEEAVLHYSQGLELEPANATLYCNRALAFLNMQQYYHAHEDAAQTIRLKPDWAKGYFRKGQVLSATYNLNDALLSYGLAYQLQPDDNTILEALKKTKLDLAKDNKSEEQVPWLGAGIGIVLGVIIVISDQTFTPNPSISHPILMALLTMVIAVLGFGVAKSYRYWLKCQRTGLLDPPVDLLKEMNQGADEDKEEPTEQRNGERHFHPRMSNALKRRKIKRKT